MKKLFSIFCCLLLSASMVTQAQADYFTWSQADTYENTGLNNGTRGVYQYVWAKGSTELWLFFWQPMSNSATYQTPNAGTWTVPPKGNYTITNTAGSTNGVFGYGTQINSEWYESYITYDGQYGYFLYYNGTTTIYVEEGADGPYIRIPNTVKVCDGSYPYNQDGIYVGSSATYYSVNVKTESATKGTVSYSMKSGYVYTNNITNWKKNSVYTLTATPKSGYRFVCWKKGSTQISTNAVTDVTIDGNATYTAYFESQGATQYTITTAVSPSNTYGTVTGAGTYYENDPATLTATSANEHLYIFDHWLKDGNNYAGGTTITPTVTANATYTAVFRAANSGTITAATNNASYGTASASLTGSQPGGTAVTLTATPNSGYAFAGWDDNNDGTVDNTDNPRTVYVDGNKEYVANFIVETASFASFSFDNPNDNIQIDKYTEPAAQCQTSFYPYGISLVEIIAKNTTRTSKNYLQMYIKTNNFRTYYPEGGSSYQGPAYGTYSVSVPSEYGPVIGNCDNSFYESNYYFVYTGDVTDVVIGYKVETASHGGTCHFQGYEGTLAQRLCSFSSYGADYSNETKSNFAPFNNGTITVAEGAGGHPYITIRIGGTLVASIGAPAQPYALAWDANGGELSGTYTAAGSVNEGTSITAPTATRTGYTFNGWSPEFTGYMPAANTTYVAQWTPQTYDITYKDQGDVTYTGANLASLPATHTYGTATDLVAGVKEGYTFGGWYENPACTGAAVTNIGATAKTADFTLYAQWTANTYNVSFAAGEGSGTMTDQVFTYGVAQNLKANTFTAPTATVTYNYNGATGGNSPASATVTATADGWFEGNNYYEEGQSVNNLTATNGATVAMTANWSWTEEITLPTPTKTGYEFDQWSFNMGGMDLMEDAGAEIAIEEDVEMTALWNIVTYNLTYEGLEGATNSSNPTSYNIESETITLADPGTRDGYIFAGWKDESDNAITEIAHGSTGNRTLTATWTKATTLDLYDDRDATYYNNIKDLIGKTYDVTLNRTFKPGRWSTICLPFDYNEAYLKSAHPLNGILYEYLYSEGNADLSGSGLTLYFKSAKSIEAGTPYLVRNSTSSDIVNPTFTEVTIDTELDTKDADIDDILSEFSYKQSGSISLVGTFRKIKLPEQNHAYMGLMYDETAGKTKIYYPGTNANVPAYRAFFHIDDATPAQQRVRIVVDGVDMGEMLIDNGELLDADKAGDRAPRKYIRNGNLYIEREGVIYDAQGKRL